MYPLVFGVETNEDCRPNCINWSSDSLAARMRKGASYAGPLQQLPLLRPQEELNKHQTVHPRHRWTSNHTPEPNELTVFAPAVEIAGAPRFIVPGSSWNITFLDSAPLNMCSLTYPFSQCHQKLHVTFVRYKESRKFTIGGALSTRLWLLMYLLSR